MKSFSRIYAALPIALALVWLQFLPEQVPLRWNLQGNIDEWGSKWVYLLFPGIVLMIVLLLMISERSERKKAGKDEKLLVRTEATIKVIRKLMNATFLILTGIEAFVFYIAGRKAGASQMGVELSRVLAVLIGSLHIAIGNYIPKAKQNAFVGFRCGWSMFNDVTWQKCNRFSGWTMVITGIGIIVCGMILPDTRFVMAAILLLSALNLVVAMIYAAKIYRAERSKQ